jgi:hypothetical protein
MNFIKLISIIEILLLASCNMGPREDSTDSQTERIKTDNEISGQEDTTERHSFNPYSRIEFLSSYEIENLTLSKDDSCSHANALRKALIHSLSNDKSTSKDIEYLRPLLISNMNSNECNFPRDNEEQSILLEFSETLFEKSNTNKDAIVLAMDLHSYFSSNVEFTEHLMELIPRIAIQNAYLFTKVAYELEEEKRTKLIESLELFKPDGLNYFIHSIDSISDKSLEAIIEAIKTQIDKEFPNHKLKKGKN